jgi:hypothetical protein
MIGKKLQMNKSIFKILNSKLMYKLLICCLLFVFASCSTSQVEDKWSSVQYMFESGPLPPKYQYSYTVTINNNCDGVMVCFIGADPSNSSLTYEFKIPKDSLIYLNDAIKKSKILIEEITEEPEGNRPVGGHLEKVRVVLIDDNPNLDRPPRVKESPYFPAKKYRLGLYSLYETIQSYVPENIWDDFNAKKEEYQSKSE